MDLVQGFFGLVAMVFTLAVPGYCLTLAFFPKRNELAELERFAFSFVFSITFLPLLVLVENQVFAVPIDRVSAFASVFGIIVFGILAWLWRTRRMKKEEIAKIWFPGR